MSSCMKKNPVDILQTNQMDGEIFLCFNNKAIPGQDIQFWSFIPTIFSCLYKEDGLLGSLYIQQRE